jgi:hypothetical protein
MTDVDDENTDQTEVPDPPPMPIRSAQIDRLTLALERLTHELHRLVAEQRKLVVKLDNHFERYPTPQGRTTNG